MRGIGFDGRGGGGHSKKIVGWRVRAPPSPSPPLWETLCICLIMGKIFRSTPTLFVLDYL